MDLALSQDTNSGLFDLAWTGTDLATDASLRPAFILSIYTNKRADPSHIVPSDDPNNPGGGDRGGYWGDWYAPGQLDAVSAAIGALTAPTDLMGSWMWLVGLNATTDADRIAFAKVALKDCTAWMIRAGICNAIDVDVWLPADQPGYLAFELTAHRPTGLQVERFDYRWG